MTEMAPTERVSPAANDDAEVPWSLLTAVPPMHPPDQCGTLTFPTSCTTNQLNRSTQTPHSTINVVGKCEVIMHALDGTWDQLILCMKTEPGSLPVSSPVLRSASLHRLARTIRIDITEVVSHVDAFLWETEEIVLEDRG